MLVYRVVILGLNINYGISSVQSPPLDVANLDCDYFKWLGKSRLVPQKQ